MTTGTVLLVWIALCLWFFGIGYLLYFLQLRHKAQIEEARLWKKGARYPSPHTKPRHPHFRPLR